MFAFAVLTITACTPRTAPSPALSDVSALSRNDMRAVRRDIPMTNAIVRAHRARTRDSTGRAGPKYWQQWVDYTINARLDPATSIITGRETITLRNNSDSTLDGIVLRLDQNYFAPNAARLEAIPPS